MRIFITALFALLAACAQAPTNPSQVEPLSGSQYRALIGKNTSHTNQYSGFHQTFQADVTILSSEVQTAMLKERASFLGWNLKQYQTEHEKAVQENSAYARYAVRLFVPDKDYEDLDKPKSIWKIYLEVNGTRLEGTAKKMTEKAAELQVLFPHSDRFSAMYTLTFNVPMNTVETGRSTVILTSSLGTGEFKFPVSQ